MLVVTFSTAVLFSILVEYDAKFAAQLTYILYLW